MIGDAYMVLAGGPVPSVHHAESITNYGLGILEETAKIIDPSTSTHLKIRVGELLLECVTFLPCNTRKSKFLHHHKYGFCIHQPYGS